MASLQKHPVKILFLAWGHSIHAERRISLFLNDPRFAVAVASTFNYRFPGALNIELTAARSARPEGTAYTAAVQQHGTTSSWSPGMLAKRVYRKATQLPGVGVPLHEAVTSMRDLRILYRAVAAFQPDVLFFQTLLYPCYLGLFLPRRIPRMITFWNGDVLAWTRHRGAERLFKRQIIASGVRQAAAITSNSQAALDACVSYGAAREKLHLIRYPGIDLSHWKALPKPEAKTKLGIPGPLILNERGPAPHQNLKTLVEAAPHILQRFPNAKFLFLSPGKADGPEKFRTYQELAQRLGVDHAMIWRGNVPHAQLPEILSATDVAVSLSEQDSLPNAMLDAMACRVPVVVADLPQIREWITHGENGFIVGPQDAQGVAVAVIRILENANLATRFSELSYRLVEQRAAFHSQVPRIQQLVIDVATAGRSQAALTAHAKARV